jgi:hypothetical protein
MILAYDTHAAMARTEHEHQRDDQHVEREGHDDVDQSHDNGVNPATEVARNRTEHDADQERQQHRDERDPQVVAQAVKQPGEGVPAQLVGAEQVMRARPLQGVGQVLRDRVVRRQQRREDRGRENEGKQDHATQQRRLGVPPPDPPRPGRGFRFGDELRRRRLAGEGGCAHRSNLTLGSRAA